LIDSPLEEVEIFFNLVVQLPMWLKSTRQNYPAAAQATVILQTDTEALRITSIWGSTEPEDSVTSTKTEK
jgi:hypothetical protein